MIFKVYQTAFGKGEIRPVDVPNDELKDNPEHDLERIFYYGQNDFQPRKQYSVSVGDIIEYKDKLYMVMMVGFKEITKEQMEAYKGWDNREKIMFARRDNA